MRAHIHIHIHDAHKCARARARTHAHTHPQQQTHTQTHTHTRCRHRQTQGKKSKRAWAWSSWLIVTSPPASPIFQERFIRSWASLSLSVHTLQAAPYGSVLNQRTEELNDRADVMCVGSEEWRLR